MKPSLLNSLSLQIILTWSTGLFLLIGCTSNQHAATTTYNIPWPSDDNTYRFQDVSISELTSPETLSGADVQIIVTPGQDSTGLTGSTPVGRFLTTSAGVRVPIDSVTTQAVAVHGHIQRLRQMTKEAGAEDLLKWPLTIAVEARARSADGSFENNAYFDSDLNALVMTNYSDRDLPLSMNGGVIGHEFFHMLFNAIVMRGLQGQFTPQYTKSSLMGDDGSGFPLLQLSPFESVSSKAQNQFLLRGINEGLADFWGWLYTGDADSVGRSLKKAEAARRLDDDFAALDSTGSIRSEITGQSPGNQLALAYVLGTSYARFMRALTNQIANGEASPAQRTAMAKILIESLQNFSPLAATKFSVSDVSPNDLLLSIYDKLPSVDADTCDLYDQFAAPGSASDSSQARPAKCSAFPVKADSLSRRMSRGSTISNFVHVKFSP